MTSALDSIAQFFLMIKANTGIVAILNLLKTIGEMFDSRNVLVIDGTHLVSTEGTSSFSDTVFLIG